MAKGKHAKLDTPLYGNGSMWNMATVTSGEHRGKSVCINVEFADGWCVCDVDYGHMELIKITDMQLWRSVDSVNTSRNDKSTPPRLTKEMFDNIGLHVGGFAIVEYMFYNSRYWRLEKITKIARRVFHTEHSNTFTILPGHGVPILDLCEHNTDRFRVVLATTNTIGFGDMFAKLATTIENSAAFFELPNLEE